MASAASSGSSRWLTVGVSLIFASYFFGFGLFLPFFPVFLEQASFTPVQIALFVAIPNIVKVVATPVATALSDRAGRRRHSMAIYGLTCAVAFLSLLFLEGYWSILAVVLLLSVAIAPLQPLSDAYAYEAVKHQGINYGFTRSWGSAAFIGATTFGGWYLGVFSAKGLQFFTAIGFIAMAAVALLSPGMPSENGGEKKISPWKTEEFKSFGLHSILLAAGLILGSMAALYSFGSLYWIEHGVADDVVGLLWSFGVISEIVVFLLGAALVSRLGSLPLILIGGLAAMVRWVVFPQALEIPHAFALQALHGASFGMVHIGLMAFLADKVPSKTLGSVQGLAGMYIGIVLGGSGLLAGWLYEINPAYAFYAMTVVACAGLLVLFSMWSKISRLKSAF
ncbi:MFS transporter [Flexibacterium corallicola]|uniref:MFS transporter n=1 Tax=Flexibacterium corallicola TaxID=3037259 RepID=UPI00286F72D8|nr:MFS transporter [Pseudovibrio sp. M1P-2-3]